MKKVIKVIVKIVGWYLAIGTAILTLADMFYGHGHLMEDAAEEIGLVFTEKGRKEADMFRQSLYEDTSSPKNVLNAIIMYPIATVYAMICLIMDSKLVKKISKKLSKKNK